MAQPDYGLLDTTLPYKVGGSVLKGMGDVNALRQQQLQNQATEFEMQNALAQQEAYKQAAQGGVGVSQALMERGLGGEAAKYQKTVAESQKLGLEGQLKKLELERERFSDLRFNPSDQNIVAHLQDSILRGDTTPEKAQGLWQQLSNMNPDQRKQYFTEMGAKADTVYKNMTLSEHDKQQLAISRGHLGLARERLAQEMAGGGQLTPETIDMAANMFLKTGQLPQLGMGKQAAAARQQILNRATVLGTTGADGQPAPTTADVAGNIVGAKQDYKSQEKAVKDFSTGQQGKAVNAFNTAIDHLGTMDKLSDALANGDTKAINAVGNMIAKQTGAPAPTNFNAAKQIVTAEIIKAIVASGGGVAEREEAARNFANANSPAQLKGVINTYKDLMGGQLKSLELQYGNTTGRKDFEKKLTPAAKEELSKVKGNLTGDDAKALEWAKANPSDPRATKIKQRLGVQ